MSRRVEIAPGVVAYRDAWRSHMFRRAGETAAQHEVRLTHSCYRCGHFERDNEVLDAHEQGCRGASPGVLERRRLG